MHRGKADKTVRVCPDKTGNLFIREVRLQTNAILINSMNLDTILSLKDRGLIIQISLEGATAPVHDRVRGKGSFDKTMKALRLLKKKRDG